MKTTRLLSFLLLASATALAQFTDIKQSPQGTTIGRRTDSKVGFFGTTPTTRPANTRTARQALQDLGLLATGGAQDSDVFDRLHYCILDNLANTSLTVEMMAV